MNKITFRDECVTIDAGFSIWLLLTESLAESPAKSPYKRLFWGKIDKEDFLGHRWASFRERVYMEDSVKRKLITKEERAVILTWVGLFECTSRY